MTKYNPESCLATAATKAANELVFDVSKVDARPTSGIVVQLEQSFHIRTSLNYVAIAILKLTEIKVCANLISFCVSRFRVPVSAC